MLWPSLVPTASEVSDKKIDKVVPIESNVKICPMVVAIFDGEWTSRTQFLKGTTQELLLPSLVSIGPVVSEQLIFVQVYDVRWMTMTMTRTGAKW